MLKAIVFLANAAVMAATPLVAQSITGVYSGAEQSASPAAAKSISAQLPPLDLRNVTLPQALDEISRKSGVPINYSRDLIPANRRVTYTAANATAESALSAVLKGTSLTYTVSSSGKVHIVPREQGTIRAKRAAGAISGVVSDAKTSKPISGASVSIGAVSDKGVTTGEDGVYRLSGVANGTHTVTARILGYAKQTRQVTVGDGATTQVDFKLEPSASVLDQVIVTGVVQATERKAIPNAMTVVTAKDIEQKGITRIDQLFRGEIPGIFAYQTPGGVGAGEGSDLTDSRYGGTVMYVRGGTKIGANGQSPSMPIKTYVNGVELANAAFLNAIDPKSIERIEVLTGPQASTIYGSGALSGVLQIFTKKGNTTAKPELTLMLQSGIVENSVSNSYTPQHDYAAQVSGTEQETSYAGGIGYTYLGRWTPGATTRTYSGYGSVRQKEGIVTAEASARISRRTMGLSGTSGTVGYRQGLGAILGELNYCGSCFVPFNQTNSLGTRTLGLVTDVSARPWWQHRVTLGTDEVTTDGIQTAGRFLTPSDSLFGVQRSSSRKLTAAYSTNVSGAITSALTGMLTMGADYTGILSDGSFISASSNIGSLTGSNASITRGDENSRGYYAQAQFAIKDKLFFTGGVRIEDNPNYGEDYGVNVAPRVGASFVHERNVATIKMRAAYGTATRAPDPTQRLARVGTDPGYPAGYLENIGNPTLQPELQHGSEGGIEVYVGDRVSLQVTRYDQKVENLIISAPTGDSIVPLPGSGLTSAFYPRQFSNVGMVRNDGWEGQGDIKLVGPLSLGGTWSYNRTRIARLEPGYRCTALVIGSPGLCRFVGGALLNVPEHTGVVRFTYGGKNTTAIVSISRVGQRTFPQNDDIFVWGGGRARLNVRAPVANTRMANAPFSVPGNTTLDIRGTHSFGRFATLTLSILNATNMYDGDAVGLRRYPVMGRQVMLGARIIM